MSKLPKIIGIGGTNGSGKDLLSEHIATKYNYLFVSAGDLVRRYCMERVGNHYRTTMIKVSNDLRREKGNGFIVLEAIEEYRMKKDRYDGLVLSSIRAKGEVDELKKAKGVLLFVDADPKIRFQRLQKRGRMDDETTYEQFLADQQTEWLSDDPGKHSIKTIKGLSDHVLMNEGSKKDFTSKFEEIFI